MLDTEEEIREIKKEIIESRSLIIKTNNLGNSLASDLKSIAKRQTSYERRLNWNSAAAYIMFAVLSFTGLKLASDARIREIEVEKNEIVRSAGELKKTLAEERKKNERRERAEARAAQFYDLIQKQKRAEAVEAYETIQKEDLSPTEASHFQDVIGHFRFELSVQRYQSGLELMHAGRYAEAAETFREAIRLRDDAAHIPATRYHLALALRKLGKNAEAITIARMVAEQPFDREIQDDATWLVAQCAETLGTLEDAKNALRTLLRKWPRSDFAADAKKTLTEMSRHGTSSDASNAAQRPPEATQAKPKK